jgi:hypothetical protein
VRQVFGRADLVVNAAWVNVRQVIALPVEQV